LNKKAAGSYAFKFEERGIKLIFKEEDEEDDEGDIDEDEEEDEDAEDDINEDDLVK
jgi:hypothetical protein